MAGLKELRGRIEAIKSTEKITSAMKMVAAAVLLLLFIYLLYPRLADAVMRARQGAAAPAAGEQFEEFNPYAPIVVVPNDYQEGGEIPQQYE